MNNNKTAKELLLNARGQLVGRYGQAILVTVVMIALTVLFSVFANYTYTGTLGTYLFRILITTIIDLLLGVLNFGMFRYFLNLVRGTKDLSPAELFHGVRNCTDKAICLEIVFAVASLITQIPTIYVLFFTTLNERETLVAAYLIRIFSLVVAFTVNMFFGMCFFVLSDKPELSVMEILAESNRLMKGRRLKYFILFLRVLPGMILGMFAFGIGVLWPMVLYYTALANFYLDAIGEEPYNPLLQQEPEEPTNSQLLT
ncbi:MAG: DUF975 family protein [Lachnospiraceae bacterium]|nr:DUF975 family protein [Lachnospiraceae bacterium]